LYTDGIVESGMADEQIEDYDLEEVVHDCVDLSLTDQVATIMAGTIGRSGGQMKDDATIIAFEVMQEHALRVLSSASD
jgi:serine phosphatase RsbU (regulator of sigma subunit)